MIYINDYNGNGKAEISIDENDTIIAKYYWLTAKCKRLAGSEIKIMAEPNTTGKNALSMFIARFMMMMQPSK